ncbi:MAG: GNAT family N-acetyltransferase [Planctomycetes bacterium]|nr:GNAT family N-acetyltransferase [Planctomycetota bacterium]
MATLVRAESPEQIDGVRGLLREYVDSLPVDLSYEHFAREVAGLPGDYAPPSGELLLALVRGAPAGCAALRPLDRQICEMKRVYLRPAFRGRGIGRALGAALVAAARRIGYRRIRLDTLASMKAAMGLYRSMGFRVILPYRSIPVEQAVFMELNLAPPT